MKNFSGVLCTIKNILEKEEKELDERIRFMEHRKEYLLGEIEGLKKRIEKAKTDYSSMENYLDNLTKENFELEKL